MSKIKEAKDLIRQFGIDKETLEMVLSKFMCKFGFWLRQSTLPGNWVASPV